MKIRIFGSQFLIRTLLLSTLLLLTSASFGVAPVSAANHLHRGHNNLVLCAALCETPVRRHETNHRGIAETKDQDESNHHSVYGGNISRENTEGTLKPIFRSRVDKVPIYKQVSVYLN